MSHACRFCATPLKPFMDMGRMPLANGFITEDALADELFYRLLPALCPECHCFQLAELPDPKKIFHAEYPHLTGLSAVVTAHYQALAADISARFIDSDDPFIVEVGSNDGTLLKNFARAGHRHLGIEPARRAAEIAMADGIETICEFFNMEVAQAVRDRHGPADVILGTNVIAHISDIRGVAGGVAALLGEDGVFVFENIYLKDMIAQTAYDQIYDEHVFTYSVSAVARVYGEFGLEIIDLKALPMQGGSLRYVLGRKGRHAPDPVVTEYLSDEVACGLNGATMLDQFRQRTERNRADMVALVEGLKAEGKRIAGYGAATKSTIMLNYCGLGPDHIDYLVDSTPAKQGRLSPGMHIPVVPPEVFGDDPPDYTIVFAWNHFDEIRGKEPGFEAGGGRWILPMPEPAIIAPLR